MIPYQPQQPQGPWCPKCNQPTFPITRAKAGPNHVLHGILSVLVCGLWLPVWIIVAMSDDGKRSTVNCGRCGHFLG